MRHTLANWIINKFSKWLTHEPALVPTYLCDFDKIRYELRPADVILVEGRNRVSSVIKQITQSYWTHSALYVGRIHDIEDPQLRSRIKKYYKGPMDEQLLIESLMGHGTIVTPLARYRDYHLRICRPLGLTGKDAQRVIAYAVGRLGMRYSLRHIFDLFRFLFPWGILPRRWRSSLFEHNALKPTEEICSLMIARAFESVRFPILPEIGHDKSGYFLVQRDPRLFVPRDFDVSPFFAIVKTPMLTLNKESAYHHLPWRKGFTSDGVNIYPIHEEDEDSPLLGELDEKNELDEAGRPLKIKHISPSSE